MWWEEAGPQMPRSGCGGRTGVLQHSRVTTITNSVSCIPQLLAGRIWDVLMRLLL